MSWDLTIGVVGNICPLCGATVPEWTGDLGFGDPTDDAEAHAARRAIARQTHLHAAHRVEPAVGDLVQYSYPWRGLILRSEVLKVISVRPDNDFHEFARRSSGIDLPPLIGTSYTLASARRPNDRGARCFPFAGDPDYPVTFELVEVAPPVEGDLMDLLGWDDAA